MSDELVIEIQNQLFKSLCLGPFPSPWTFSAHHVNAYESSPSEIVLDLAPTPFHNMRDYLKLDNMLNPPGERDDWQ